MAVPANVLPSGLLRTRSQPCHTTAAPITLAAGCQTHNLQLCVLMFDIFHGTAPTYLNDFAVAAAVTAVFDHQHAATSWCGGQGHASLIVRSQLLDLPPSFLVNIRNFRSHSAFCLQLNTYLFTVPD